jgi:hypothetical protein
MARRKIDVTPSGISVVKDLPTMEEVVNSVPTSDYEDAISNAPDVMAHWNRFKVERGGGRGLDMISGVIPGKDYNTKISKNATHSSMLVASTHQMAMSLAQGSTSGLMETCGGCRTPGCTSICNGSSGKMAINSGDNTAERAKQIRTAYWSEHPQMAGALAVIQSRQGAAAARSIGMIPALRTNMWQDVDWTKTNLRGPWIDSMEENAGPHRAEGIAQDFPLMSHTNYTKDTFNRNLRPGESEPDAKFPRNYSITGSVSELTPMQRIRDRLAAGGTMHGVFWATKTQPKPSEITMEDRSGDRETFPAFDADNMDAIMHNRAIGNVGIGMLRHKQTAGLRELEGNATTSSMVRPIDPDAPVGSRTGIPTKYATEELIARSKMATGPSTPIRGSRRGAAGF